jgi:hypothetical protein
MTPLDRAHRAADTDEARLAFWNALAEAELHLLLAEEAGGEAATPRLFEVDGARYALAFDLPERLTAFADGPAPTATLSGRRLAGLLAAEGLGLGLNLEDAPSAQILPPDAIAWLATTLAAAPEEAERRIDRVTPPGDLPEELLTALDAKLRLTTGLARSAYLAGVDWEGGGRGHVLAFVDPVPGAEPDLARAVREALVFSGLEAGSLDVTFLRVAETRTATLARHGLRIDLPQPEAPPEPKAPGSGGPPRLR